MVNSIEKSEEQNIKKEVSIKVFAYGFLSVIFLCGFFVSVFGAAFYLYYYFEFQDTKIFWAFVFNTILSLLCINRFKENYKIFKGYTTLKSVLSYANEKDIWNL